MNKLRNLIEYAKELSREPEAWALAYRRRGEKALYEGNADGFTVIPNTARYWKADPFLFTHGNKTYLFCEMLDRKTGKGVIGAARLKNGKCSAFRVCLDLPQHLSFPCVFEKDGDIFMMPEYGASGEIAVFRAVRFPTRWEKAYTLAPFAGYDTVPVPSCEAPLFYLTTGEQYDVLLKFRAGDAEWQTAAENDPARRGAGFVIETQAGLLRPTQNDEGSYGNSLHFNLIDDVTFEGFREHCILRVLPPESPCGENEISIRLREPSAIRYGGVHTYNRSEDYEVVDLVYYGEPNRYIFRSRRKKFIQHILKKL